MKQPKFVPFMYPNHAQLATMNMATITIKIAGGRRNSVGNYNLENFLRINKNISIQDTSAAACAGRLPAQETARHIGRCA